MRIDGRNTHQLTVNASQSTTSLRAVIAQGERGEQGLPGNASAAWTASSAVTTGTVRQAPDGSWIKSTASRTTRASFDATEQGFWTVVGATPGTLESDAYLATTTQLLGTALDPFSIANGAITRNASGAPTGFAVEWPDGTTGVYAGTASGSFPSAIDSYTVTYVGDTTLTFTQAAVTRDASGNVTNRPKVTVA